MRIRIDESNTHRGRTFTELTLVTDDGRKIGVSAEHAHCHAEFDCDDDTPLQVGDFLVSPTKIADLAMLGNITEEGDLLEVTADWLTRVGFDGN